MYRKSTTLAVSRKLILDTLDVLISGYARGRNFAERCANFSKPGKKHRAYIRAEKKKLSDPRQRATDRGDRLTTAKSHKRERASRLYLDATKGRCWILRDYGNEECALTAQMSDANAPCDLSSDAK